MNEGKKVLRHVPKVLALVSSLALFGAESCAQSTASTLLQCAENETDCTTVCSNLKTDPLNCGSCGKECPAGQVCNGGSCSTMCPSGNSICGGEGGPATCVNTKSDNANCGKCGAKCATGQVCSGGGCGNTCGGSQSGQTLCAPDGGSPYCAHLQNDNQNCGKCGTKCQKTEVCQGGMCGSQCTMDQTMCGLDAGMPYCANLQTDNDNCGDCGVKCGVLQACVQGACVSQCANNQKICMGDGGAYCVNYLTDNKNCGNCGVVCPQNTPVCFGGQCKAGGSAPSCQFVNGLNWCYNPNACGQPCNTLCAALGMSVYNNAGVWFAAQNTTQLCQNISMAFGLGSNVSMGSYTYACLEDSAAVHQQPGGPIGPLLCSTYNGCPQQHLTNMDQNGAACNVQSRRSICPCQ